MAVTVQEYQVDERALVENVRGRELAWLAPEGVHMATMRFDAFEVPRVPTTVVDSSLGSLEEIAAELASRFEMEILKVCHWPAGHAIGVDVPDAVGLVLARPLT